MIVDIMKKYSEFNFPEFVTTFDLQRIKNNYQIPQIFYDNIFNSNQEQSVERSDSNNQIENYSPFQDIRSSKFDPLIVLTNRNLIASNLHSNLVDNLSKAKYLLPGSTPEPIRKNISSKSNSSMNNSTTTTTSSSTNSQNQNQNLHILDRIAESSSKEKIVNEEGEITFQDSPLALLDKFMKEKKRVRILIRNKNR